MSNIDAYKKVANFFSYDESKKELILSRYCEACLYFLNLYYNNDLFKRKYYKDIIKDFRNYYKLMVKNTSLTLKQNIYAKLVYICPILALSLKKIYISLLKK